MRAFFLYTILAFCLINCRHKIPEPQSDFAYLGGEVINANSNFVVLYKEHTVVDTVPLTNNRFIYKINHLESGLYTFAHGGEIQMVLLEPQDSIMFRLNTLDFDESLVFTGKGAKKNNYLINMFLENEKENEKVLKYSQSKPKTFEKSLDSLKEIKLKRLETFKTKFETTPLFDEIAQANIDYNYYLSKEVYPFAYYGSNELKNLQSLPEDFYSYRENIDYNNNVLRDYFPYYYFLRYHFNNLALQEHFKHSNDSVFDRKSLDYNLDKIKLIDSLVSNDSIKNGLLKDTAIRFLNTNKNVDEYDALIDAYLKSSTSKTQKRQVSNLANSLKRLRTGSSLPNIEITDYNNQDLSIHSIIDKPTVIYFWSYTIKGHFKESHYKIKSLKAKYPEVDFIAININSGDPKFWKTSLKEFNFPAENEYQFKSPLRAKETLAINAINKVMIVDKNSKIVDCNANMFSPMFEEEILGLISK
ncbi:TlpA family protein disulfide reductase [Mangrovimonas aestuarii]|uniref:TlpA family protein disulfide reductase n=1 Tax=Mangrovimonas aestuarii TaxID=3018443 RepID=UPI002377DACB|nr:thioredoxin-like domain-containing protein [Mangrovimonas aestuarii]